MDDEKRKNVVLTLMKLGCMPNTKGFQYLREEIIMCLENRTNITNMTKLIYPEIARKYSTSEKAVERASRAAIHSGWSRRDKKLTKSIFGNTLQFETEIPSSTLFIAAVVEWIAT